MAKSAWCCPLGPSRCFAMVFMVSRKFFSPSLSLVIVSCSRVCLLAVFRLFGLPLRPLDTVCCCHGYSLTRWMLALAQEATRVVSSASSRFCSSICLVLSDNLRGRSLQAMRTCDEGPASLVNLFFTHYSFLCLAHSSQPYNRDTVQMCYILVP